MTRVIWDAVGERTYETGVDRCVLYIPNGAGAYIHGYAWNGLTTVTESPTGADSNPQYADNIKYLDLQSAEQFGATIEAFTYPEQFGQCDGTAEPTPGVLVGQQNRRIFGFSYRTILGNDVDKNDHAYKLHLIYGALASPSDKAYQTVNDSPAPIGFSWDVTTTPVAVGTIGSVTYKPTAQLTIDSSRVDADALAALEDMLYGTVGVDPMLPAPADVVALFADTITTATPTAPTFNSGTHTITIPTVTGVTYTIDGEPVTGAVVITEDTIVIALPNTGYVFPPVIVNEWFFDFV